MKYEKAVTKVIRFPKGAEWFVTSFQCNIVIEIHDIDGTTYQCADVDASKPVDQYGRKPYICYSVYPKNTHNRDLLVCEDYYG